MVRGLATFGATDFTIGHVAAVAPSTSADGAQDPAAPSPELVAPPPTSIDDDGRTVGQTFAIADLVERIETFQRIREQSDPAEEPAPDRFSLETDAHGMICWVDGIRRAGLVGRSVAPVETCASRRASSETLRIDGPAGSTCEWVISAVPLFAPDTGRFVGYRGTARRVELETERAAIEPEALRRLVHELRTPTNAIAGFAELISTEMFGPSPLRTALAPRRSGSMSGR